jgi:hypothetical protein
MSSKQVHLQFLADVLARSPVLENSRNSLRLVNMKFAAHDRNTTYGFVVEQSHPSVRTTVVSSVNW